MKSFDRWLRQSPRRRPTWPRSRNGRRHAAPQSDYIMMMWKNKNKRPDTYLSFSLLLIDRRVAAGDGPSTPRSNSSTVAIWQQVRVPVAAIINGPDNSEIEEYHRPEYEWRKTWNMMDNQQTTTNHCSRKQVHRSFYMFCMRSPIIASRGILIQFKLLCFLVDFQVCIYIYLIMCIEHSNTLKYLTMTKMKRY